MLTRIDRGLALLLPLLVLSTACGDSADAETGDGEGGEFRALTWNVGLAPLDVDYATERASPVVAALAAVGVDLLCVQEFWQEEDWDALVAATESRLPSTERLPAEPVEGTCTPAEMDPLQTCVDDACPDLAGEPLANCALGDCGAEISGLTDLCFACLVAQIEEGADIDQLRTACRSEADPGEMEAFIYGGAYDTGILTSAPVLAEGSLVLDSYLLRASVNWARVDTSIGDLDVFCTHLASAIPQSDYGGDFGDWKGEQARQIEQLLAFIDEKSSEDGSSGQIIVLGDLNTGPAIQESGIESEWPENFQHLVEAGLTAPYLAQSDVQCTDCPENSFHAADSAPKLIDHVLLRGVAASAHVERVMTQTVTIEVDGETVETNLSDHFGLQLTLEGEVR